MATKGLGNETLVTSILRSNTVLVEVGGSVRRITVENFMNAINNGDEQMLRQVAWGIPIKQSTQSSTNYGVIGNTAAWTEYKLYCGRYLVTNDGRAAKMSPTNSAVFADGTAVDETKGHVMWIGSRLYYRVQTGAFRKRENADRMLYLLQEKGYPAYILQDGELYKVQVGAFLQLDNAIRMEQKLREDGYCTLIVTK